MTTNDFQVALARCLKFEGSEFVNDPDDLGGATRYGITQTTYNRFRTGKPARSVAEISANEISEIYFKMYWLPSGCTQLPTPLSQVMFDTAVQFGVGDAVRMLQFLVGTTPDGIFGRLTLNAIIQTGTKANFLARAMVVMRKLRRHERVLENAKQKKFLQGWLNRDNQLLKEIGG